MKLIPLPAFQDNYLWLLHDGQPAPVVDPSKPQPVMAYLPPEQALEGNQLAVEYFGELYPVTVAVAGATPLFDPENARVRS